jgi:predicted TPR repeat methyltransferase
MVFTVEALDAPEGENDPGFHLQPHGRYSHRERYLRQVLAEAGMSVGSVAAAHLRIEAGKPVNGWIVSAQLEK